jgi:hypothetical protein
MRTKTTSRRDRIRRSDETRRQIAARNSYEDANRYYRTVRAANTDDEEIRAARRVRDATFDEYMIAIGRVAA